MDKGNFKTISFDISPMSSLYNINLNLRKDNINNCTKIYTKDLFSNFKTFNLVQNYDENDDVYETEEEIIEKKKQKQENEEFHKKYENLMNKMNSLQKSLQEDTYKIKLEMESDKEKKEQLEKEEKKRIELEKENLRKKLEEKRRKEELENLERENKRKKRMQELFQRQNEESKKKDAFLRGHLIITGNIKEKLIKAGNNYENITRQLKEISKIKITEKYLENGNEKINQLNSPELIDQTSKDFINLFKEIQEMRNDNSKEIYLYLCNVILSKIFSKLENNKDYNFVNYYMYSKLLLKIKSKTLSYLFFQRVSNICPYIIPVIYTEKDFPDKNILKERQGFLKDDKELKNVNKRFTNYEYMYFTYLFIDIIDNKNTNSIEILEDYLNNVAKIDITNINYLISNSFVCFVNVFGNYLKSNNSRLFNNLDNIFKKIYEGIQNEKNTTKKKEIKAFDDLYEIKLQSFYKEIKANRNTEFIKEVYKIKRNIS